MGKGRRVRGYTRQQAAGAVVGATIVALFWWLCASLLDVEPTALTVGVAYGMGMVFGGISAHGRQA